MANKNCFLILVFICLAICPVTLAQKQNLSNHSTKSALVFDGQYVVTRYNNLKNQRRFFRNSKFKVLNISNTVFLLTTGTVQFRKSRPTKVIKKNIKESKVQRDCARIKRSDRNVKYCEPNYVVQFDAVPDDAKYNTQWHHRISSSGTNVESAWDKGTGSKSIIVAVIDSGISTSHPDLSPNLWVNPADPIDGYDNDGNGYVDDVHGSNTADHNTSLQDCMGHGTHVAGIIGAKGNNSYGVSGVNWDVSLLTVKVAPGCSSEGSFYSVHKAYDYIYDLKLNRDIPVRFVNASYGTTSGPSQIDLDAIRRLNSVDIILVAAAGNEDTNNDVVPHYPSSYSLSEPNVIGVAALSCNGNITQYTNYGSSVNIAAPGGAQSYSGDSCGISSTSINSSGFEYMHGTSMAAPVVTGALALIASQRPYLNSMRVKELIYAAADRSSTLMSWVHDGKKLNIGYASVIGDQISDSCPDDINKFEPGYCGCGSPENYRDPDGDGTKDCVDVCPLDRNKIIPGICGCGVSDIDRDQNGVSDCKDSETANALYGQIRNVKPPKPRLKLSGNRLNYYLKEQPGFDYILEVSVAPLRNLKSISTKYYIGRSAALYSKAPAKRTKITVGYYYKVPGRELYSLISQKASIIRR
jgi:subtilisin family serine protease